MMFVFQMMVTNQVRIDVPPDGVGGSDLQYVMDMRDDYDIYMPAIDRSSL